VERSIFQFFEVLLVVFVLLQHQQLTNSCEEQDRYFYWACTTIYMQNFAVLAMPNKSMGNPVGSRMQPQV
jgi:hypothetical protein